MSLSSWLTLVAFVQRLRRQVVLKVFGACFTEVSTVNMDMLMRNFQYQYHPRCLEGSLTEKQCVADLEEGICLERSGAPQIEDLMDYCALIGYRLSEDQFNYCITNAFPSL